MSILDIWPTLTVGVGGQTGGTLSPLQTPPGGSVILSDAINIMPNAGIDITPTFITPALQAVTSTVSAALETMSDIPTTLSKTVQNLIASDSNALTTLPTLTTPAPEAAGALMTMPANQLLIGTAETASHFTEGAQNSFFEGAQNAFNSATSGASSMFGAAGSYLNSSLYYTAATAGVLGLMWVGWKLHERFATGVVQNNYNNQTVTCNCPPPQVIVIKPDGTPLQAQSMFANAEPLAEPLEKEELDATPAVVAAA